jgi:RNA 2',3'-cyclic 3'-phosphodiesterase
MIRAFVGIGIPPAVRGALTVQQFLLPLPRRVEPETFHLTLVFLGDCAHDTLQTAHEGFEALREAGFPLQLQGLGLFGRDKPHTVWAGVAPSPPLVHLQRKVETISRRAGCQVDARKFTPHVTLGRFPPPAFPETARLERAVAMGAGFRTDPWPVTDLVLWQSLRTGKGPHYAELARYPMS